KLIDVVKLIDLTEGRHIEREMLLVKVNAVGEMREEIKRLVDIFRGRIIDVTERAYTVELTGNGEKLDAFIEALRGAGIVEVVGAGGLALARGGKGQRLDDKQGQAPVARAASAG